jgi:hypothetical protein
VRTSTRQREKWDETKVDDEECDADMLQLLVLDKGTDTSKGLFGKD